MSMETALFGFLSTHASLTPLISARIYPGKAPQATVWPYVVFSRVSSTSVEDQGGGSGLEAVRVQFDTYARTYGETCVIRDALKVILQDELFLEVGGVSFRGAHHEGDVDVDVGEVDVFHNALDFEVWHH